MTASPETGQHDPAIDEPVETGAKPPLPPEAAQFDFWVGEWDLTWGEDGQGTNKIIKILDRRVIHESFSAMPAVEFRGISLSVFDTAAGLWKQTWVDSSGLYLDFVGGWEGDRMVLQRQGIVEGQPVSQRMVWYNIQMDTLEWLWQRSEDGDDSWSTLWHIHYQRRPS